MKALLIATSVSLLIVLAVAEVEAASATGGFPYPLVSELSVSIPSNSTYSSEALTLNVTADALAGYTRILMSYSLDGEQQCPIPITETYNPHYGTITYANGTTKTAPSMFSRNLMQCYVALPDLTEGSHNIVVYAEYDYPNTNKFDYRTADRLITPDQQTITYLDNSTVHFTINADSSIMSAPTDVALSNNLATNPSLQKTDDALAIIVSVVVAIAVAVSAIALTLLRKKARSK